jgi:SAM-dependent methyltransferase
MFAEDVADAVRRYADRYAQHGYQPLTLGWTKGRQQLRFAAALEMLGQSFDSVLDVGCGFGDLFGYLRGLGWRGRYLGVDLVPELLEEGRRRYGPLGAHFERADLTATDVDFHADVAVAIGIFNHRLRQDNLAFLRQMLAAMWRHTTVAVTADFLSATANRRRDDLFYAPVGEVVQAGLALSKRVMLHHGYMPFEFNLTVWHDDSFTVETPVFKPYLKYVVRDGS